MASKKTSTRALTGMRQLTKQIPYAHYSWDATKWIPVTGPGTEKNVQGSGWKNIPSIYNCAIANESYIDLSGYELDDLTTVLRSVKVQDPGVYLFSGADKVFQVYDMLSTERLSELELGNIVNNHRVLIMSGPGMPQGPLDRDQIPFGLYRMFTHNSSNLGLPELMINARTSRFGSGEPIAVQKLWVYRLVIMIDQPAGPQTITIPASTFVINAQIVQEDEIPYFFRLKRSYELATGN